MSMRLVKRDRDNPRWGVCCNNCVIRKDQNKEIMGLCSADAWYESFRWIHDADGGHWCGGEPQAGEGCSGGKKGASFAAPWSPQNNAQYGLA